MLNAGYWMLDDAVGTHCWSSELKMVPGDLNEQALVKLENDCAQASSVARVRSAGRAGLTVKARTKQRTNLVFTFLSFFSFWICCLFLLLFYL